MIEHLQILLNHILMCILVLFDLNGCEAIAESHMLPDGLLGRLCCGNAGSRLALLIGCFMGQTKMPWKIGRAVVVVSILKLQERPIWQKIILLFEKHKLKNITCLTMAETCETRPRFIGWRELRLRTAGTPKLQSPVKSMASWNKIKNCFKQKTKMGNLLETLN